jgi:ligand-binding sensor domain-containing protein/signal transduction histidine kinase
VRLMDRSRQRVQHYIVPGVVLAWMLLAWRPCAFALDPALDVSQYAHTVWKVRDGFLKGAVRSIAQTPDGYLWLGTEYGLHRFDGVRNVLWRPPSDQQLPSSEIRSLLVARDGTLWIGTTKGLASWKDGKFTQYGELAGRLIFRLLEDREGMVWVGAGGVPTGRLCSIQNGGVRCYGEDGGFGVAVIGLNEDSKGNIWVGVANGLWRWKPGPPKFYSLPGEPDGVQSFAEDHDGALLIGTLGGIRRFVDGRTEAYSFPTTVGPFWAKRLLKDRDGNLWIGTSDRGLFHIHQGRMDVFEPSDGLTGENIYTFFEDREGNIWVSTINGLHRFRDVAVATLIEKPGAANSTVASVLATKDGSVWHATRNGLNRWNNEQISIYSVPAAQSTQSTTSAAGPDGPPKQLIPHSLFEDHRGRIWVSTSRGLSYLEGSRFVPVGDVPAGNVTAIAQDALGNLWVVNEHVGLFQVADGSVVRRIPWANLGRKDLGTALIVDPLQGGLWLGFYQGGVAYLTDGQIRASYTAAEGLGNGRVNHLRLDQDGALWVAKEGGLSRLKNGRVDSLTIKNGLPCEGVHWTIEDDARALWLYTACGLVRIALTELDAWALDSKRTIHSTVFDSSDGVRILAIGSHYSPQVTKSSDGKLWFTSLDGVSVVDPRHLRINQLPPPVHIEQITADRKTYIPAAAANGLMRLPPLIRDLEIDYTALSLVAPEKILFRYKLEPRDIDWQDGGARRQAFYNDLPPGNYRFRVMACNNSGVWNEAGAFLDFSIAPAYYQTTWFLLSCAAAFAALLGALYQLRLRQVARQFNLRLEGRVGERTRIARELHDTLLQSFQGALLKFHAVTYLLPDRPSEARQKLESVIDQAQEAIVEGRDAVQGLRSSTMVTNDLAHAITTLGEELAADQTGPNYPDFRVIVEGASRDLVPLVRDEVYRIASEALRNAFRHAQAGRIEVEILYAKRQLRLCVRDNGKGIDPKVLAEGRREGHYGLAGVHERAKLVGGKLAIWSKPDSGTEAELSIPASLAYAKSPGARRSLFSRKKRDSNPI